MLRGRWVHRLAGAEHQVQPVERHADLVVDVELVQVFVQQRARGPQVQALGVGDPLDDGGQARLLGEVAGQQQRQDPGDGFSGDHVPGLGDALLAEDVAGAQGQRAQVGQGLGHPRREDPDGGHHAVDGVIRVEQVQQLVHVAHGVEQRVEVAHPVQPAAVSFEVKPAGAVQGQGDLAAPQVRREQRGDLPLVVQQEALIVEVPAQVQGHVPWAACREHSAEHAASHAGALGDHHAPLL